MSEKTYKELEDLNPCYQVSQEKGLTQGGFFSAPAPPPPPPPPPPVVQQAAPKVTKSETVEKEDKKVETRTIDKRRRGKGSSGSLLSLGDDSSTSILG